MWFTISTFYDHCTDALIQKNQNHLFLQWRFGVHKKREYFLTVVRHLLLGHLLLDISFCDICSYLKALHLHFLLRHFLFSQKLLAIYFPPIFKIANFHFLLRHFLLDNLLFSPFALQQEAPQTFALFTFAFWIFSLKAWDTFNLWTSPRDS